MKDNEHILYREKFPLTITTKREWLQIGTLSPKYPTIAQDTCWQEILPKEVELLGSVLETLVNSSYPFTHQKEALKHLLDTHRKTKELIINGGTYSGKSLSFSAPGIAKLLTSEIDFMVIFYPSKQLLMDQQERMIELVIEVERQTGIQLTTGMYSGDTGKTNIASETLLNKELYELETNPPHILLATFDKVWSQLLRGNKSPLMEKLLNCQYLVFDEIHAFDGFAAAIIRLFIRVHKLLNPNCQLILSSATIDKVKDFRDNFLPEAKIITCPSVRGEQVFRGLAREHTIPLLVDLYEGLEALPGKACLVFVDSKEDIELLAERICAVLKEKYDFFNEDSVVVIHADIPYNQRKKVLDTLQHGERNSIRMIISSSVLELGVNIENIQTIVNIGVPITGKDGIVQRMGRNRSVPGGHRVNYFLFDETSARDRFYWVHKELLLEILETNACNPILYPKRNVKVFVGIVILMLRYGITDFQAMMEFFHREGVVVHEIARQQYARLVTHNILKKANGKVLFTSKGGELLLRYKELVPFSLRAIDSRWTINQSLGVDSSNMAAPFKQAGKIATRDVLRKGVPGNVLTRSRKHYFVEDFDQRIRSIFVKEYLTNESTGFITVPPLNILREPTVTLGVFPKIKQGPKLMTVHFGQLSIEQMLKTIVKNYPDGKVATQTKEKGSLYSCYELSEEEAQSLSVRDDVEGVVLSLQIESVLKGKSNKTILQLFGKILLIETEIVLGIPSSEIGIISTTKQLTLFDKGKGIGNTSYLYKYLKVVAEQMAKRLGSCACAEGCKSCYGEITGELPKGSKAVLLRLVRDLEKITEKDWYDQFEEEVTIQPNYQDEKIIALSDIHLGSEFSFEEEFFDALGKLSKQADILIINGDLLDKGGGEAIDIVKKLLTKAIQEGYWSKLVLIRSSTIHDAALASFANILQQDYAWIETTTGDVLFVHGNKIGINPKDVQQTNAEGATIIAKGKLMLKGRSWLPHITKEIHLVIGHLHERFYNERWRVYGLGHWTKKGNTFDQKCYMEINTVESNDEISMRSYEKEKEVVD